MAREGRPLRRTFATVAEALTWRREMQLSLRRGWVGAPSGRTLRQAAEDWLALAKDGVVRTRSGDRYKPSALRSYEASLGQLLPTLGDLRLSAVSATRLQDIVDELVAAGKAASTVRNTVLPLRAIYRRALAREEVAANPTLKLALPAVRARRERVARPQEATALIAAAPAGERAIWATALYCGLRLGELLALSWDDVDFAAGLLRVEHAWDRVAGLIEPKSRAGRRRVPLASSVKAELRAHRQRQGHDGRGFVFGRTPERPFDPSTVATHAREAWKRAGLVPIGFHECRHTYAAFMIAAGVNAKALSSYMGHSTITVTLDRYGHLLPGNEHEAAAMLDNWLERAHAASKQIQPSPLETAAEAALRANGQPAAWA